MTTLWRSRCGVAEGAYARQRADGLPGGGGRKTPTSCPCRNAAVVSPGTGQGTVRAKELHLEIVTSS